MLLLQPVVAGSNVRVTNIGTWLVGELVGTYAPKLAAG